MKREEAIKYLIKPVSTSTEIGEEKQKEFEAYDMAIKALSQITQIGCTGCEYYDQQQTRLICHECKRYYSDKYKDGEDE